MEHRDILRILDANLNRAREALRVVEEHVRFRLGEPRLTAAAQALRHDLTRWGGRLPPRDLLAARDAAGDVGVRLEESGKVGRADGEDVLTAACKRLQEALRVIEEYGKVLLPPDATAEVERLRFRAYDLERELAASAPVERFARSRLCVLVTEALCSRPWLEVVRAAAQGGADVVQLREKQLPDGEFLRRAEQALEACRRAGAIFVVNDRLDAALLAGADGVHLGQDDLPAARVRRMAGPVLAVGVSTHNLEQARRAAADGADYLGAGPVFPTATKPHEPVAGLDVVRRIASEVTVPCFALGGINHGNVKQVVEAGIERVAVCAAVVSADDPESAARHLRRALPD